MSSKVGPSRAPLHLVLLTDSFPYGEGEEFLEDEIPVLAGHFAQITIVAEATGNVERPVPANGHVISVADPPTRRVRLLPRALAGLAGDWRRGRGVRARVHMLRAFLYYLRHAPAIVNAAQLHLASRDTALPLCFYSYWLDYRALAATRLRQLYPGSPAVSRAHGWDVYAERHPYGYLPLRQYIASRLTAIYPVSDSGARELRHQLPEARHIRTCRLGVPAIANSPPSGVVEPARGLLVLSVGSLIPLKRIDLLVEALAQLEPDSGFSWLHLGDGPQGGALRLEATRLRIPFSFAGRLPHQDLRQTLAREASRAVLVNTSASEGIPVSMMEAMACGIPCIGTNVGGVAEIIEDDVNGSLLPADPTPTQIRAALERHSKLPTPDRAAMRAAAYDTWRTQYQAARNYTAFASRLAALAPER